MSKSCLIIGARSQLGLALQEQYPKARAVDVDELDITSEKSIKNFDWDGADVIINAAAYTNVDGAETSEGRLAAWAINADGAANLVAVAAQHGATLVHISTDYVFDGTQEEHTEAERFSPLNVYGASKAAGDIAVSLAPDHYILRTSWVIGEGKNFVRTMLDLAEKDVKPSVVNDQIGRLTFTSELVRAIDHMIATPAACGTYNVTNSGDSASWAEIAEEVFRLAKYDCTVTGVSTEEYYEGKEGIATRPLNSTLDLTKLQSTNFESRDWREELAKYVVAEQVRKKSN